MTEARSGSTESKPTEAREPLSAELFHRHVDGELDAEGLAALTRAAAADPIVKRRLEGLLEVGAVVRDAVAAQTPAIDSLALWAAVEGAIGVDAGVAEPAPRAKPVLRVIEGGAADSSPRIEGNTAALAPDRGARVRRFGAALIGIAAIAAVAVLAFRGGEAGPEVAVTPRAPDSGGIALAPMRSDSTRTEVLEVDFGTNIGTIFAIESEGGDRFAVVWLVEGEEPTRGPRPESAPGGEAAHD